MDVTSNRHRVKHVEITRRQSGQPEQRQTWGKLEQIRLRSHLVAGSQQPLGRARPPDARTQRATSRPARRHRRRIHRSRAGRRRRRHHRSPPRPATCPAGARHSGRRGQRRVGCSRSAWTLTVSEPACAGRVAPARDRRNAPRPLRCRGHTARSGSQGSALGSVPEATARLARGPRSPETGTRCWHRLHRAHRGWPPAFDDRRWVSQRSMPRVGTDTTSGVIGSWSGHGHEVPPASTPAPSAESERWTMEHPERRVRRGCLPARPDQVPGPACRP